MKKPRKKKRSRKPRRSAPPRRQLALVGAATGSTAISLSIDFLEVARGNDGFLRGLPEPSLVCGLFAVSADGTSLLGRQVCQFEQPTAFPQTVAARAPALIEATWMTGPDAALVVIVIGLEVDGGADVQRAYARLEDHAHLMLLDTSETPTALHLAELISHKEEWRTPRAVDVTTDGSRWDQSCTSDDWIAAAAFVPHARGPVRLRLLAADGKNDWTAKLTLR